MDKYFVKVKICAIWLVAYANLVLSADYCEHGLCESEEYCCGENKCCKNTVNLWYFWGAVLLLIFGLAVAGGLRYTRNKHATYVLLTTQPPEES